MNFSNHNISPVFSARDRQTFELRSSNASIAVFAEIEREATACGDSFEVEGTCIPCDRTVSFAVDMLAGGRREGGRIVPNWRERLVCPYCKMSNRQRLMVALVMQHLLGTTGQKVYLMEQTTPLYQWIVGHLSMHAITGSEYLGDGYRAGEIVKAWRYHAPLRACALPRTALHKARLFYSMLRMGGVRHEDVTGLSFEAGSLDFIVSNDIFEHVADPWKAFAECARVLRPGGVLLATLPFYRESDTSVVRAKLAAGGINYLLPPIFHGNPVSVDGSLVFTDFGWDVFVDMKEAGFAEVGVEVYASAEYGHFGDGQLVFRARR